MKNLQQLNLQLFTTPLKHVYKSCPHFLIFFLLLLQGLFMVSQSYTLNSSLNEATINVSGFPIGIYAVVLIVDGNPVHAKQLIIN